MPHKNVYLDKMKVQLDELNSAIEKLEGAAQVGEVQVMNAYQEEARKLRLQSHTALAKLEELKSASESSWEDLKAEMEKTRDALVYTLHHFKSRI